MSNSCVRRQLHSESRRHVRVVATRSVLYSLRPTDVPSCVLSSAAWCREAHLSSLAALPLRAALGGEIVLANTANGIGNGLRQLLFLP